MSVITISSLLFAGLSDELSCGATALYLLLHSHGHQVALTDLSRELPYSKEGSSLEDLIKSGSKYAPQVEARKVSRIELLSIGVNGVIAHLKPVGDDSPGHFVFVRPRKDGGGLEAIEPQFGSVSKSIVGIHFLNRFSGWIVEIPESNRLRWPFVIGAFTLVLGSAYFIYFWLSQRTRNSTSE